MYICSGLRTNIRKVFSTHNDSLNVGTQNEIAVNYCAIKLLLIRGLVSNCFYLNPSGSEAGPPLATMLCIQSIDLHDFQSESAFSKPKWTI